MPGNGGGPRRKQGDWLKIGVCAPTEMADALTDFLMEIGTQGVFQETLERDFPIPIPEKSSQEVLKAFLPFDSPWDNKLAALQAYLDSLAEIFPDIEKPFFNTEIIRDPDWGEAWKKYFKPYRVTPNIVIKPTWESFSTAGREIVIEIDPGMAFGTGQHASTRMCLKAIEELFLQVLTPLKPTVLDVGTGTGILGIACAKLGAQEVFCLDNDEMATDIARCNVAINRVDDRVFISNQGIETLKEPFYLVVANLTAQILDELYPHLLRLVRTGGYLVISGIIKQNRSDIEARFLCGDFSLHHLIAEEEWVCYVLKREEGRP